MSQQNLDFFLATSPSQRLFIPCRYFSWVLIIFNNDQEPSLYLNGSPVCARPANKIGEYAELGNVTRDKLKEDEAEFVRVCEGKMKDNGDKLKFVDVNKKENEVEVKTIVTLHDVIEGMKEKFPGLVHMRIPICNSASPLEKDFDTLCDTLVGTSINTPIILNDQVTEINKAHSV